MNSYGVTSEVLAVTGHRLRSTRHLIGHQRQAHVARVYSALQDREPGLGDGPGMVQGLV